MQVVHPTQPHKFAYRIEPRYPQMGASRRNNDALIDNPACLDTV